VRVSITKQKEVEGIGRKEGPKRGKIGRRKGKYRDRKEEQKRHSIVQV
jgi:hypothetical protein